MNSLTFEIKKFLQNKNTVTVLGVILAILVLYFAYTIRIKNAINPISVPYATEQILAGTEITQSMISTRLVPPDMLRGEVILNINSIVGKQVASDVVIPKGSLFYKRAVVEPEQANIPDRPEIPAGHEYYRLSVDNKQTYGNSIIPGNYVDIWITALSGNKVDSVDTVIVGKLFSNVKVLLVNDSNAKPVFQNLAENRIPQTIIFSLPSEYVQLLTKAEKLTAYDVKIKLVPTHESLKEESKRGEVQLASEELKNWIISKSS